jgi:hypothetical protein
MMKRQNKHTVPANPGWIEHKGGFVLSLFFHILLFSLFLKRPPTKETQRILIPPRLTMELIMPDEMMQPTPEILPSEARATHSQDAPEESQTPKTGGNQAAEPAETGKDANSLIPENTLSEFQGEIARERNNIERSLSGIHGEIEKRGFRAKGAKADFDSEGADQGTIRILDVGDIPEKILDEVFRKYNIRIVQKYIEGENNIEFLNKVKTRNKTFLSQKGTGYYEVFEIPPQAMKKMTLLEQAEMQKKGLDPNKTRVAKIVFGIVENEGNHDLGVTDFEFQELE